MRRTVPLVFLLAAGLANAQTGTDGTGTDPTFARPEIIGDGNFTNANTTVAEPTAGPSPPPTAPTPGSAAYLARLRLELDSAQNVTCGDEVFGRVFNSTNETFGDALFRIDLPDLQRVSLSTCTISTIVDTVLEVFTLPEVTFLDGNDDAGAAGLECEFSSRSSQIFRTFLPGSYLIAVQGYDGAAGAYGFTVECGDGTASTDGIPGPDQGINSTTVVIAGSVAGGVGFCCFVAGAIVFYLRSIRSDTQRSLTAVESMTPRGTPTAQTQTHGPQPHMANAMPQMHPGGGDPQRSMGNLSPDVLDGLPQPNVAHTKPTEHVTPYTPYTPHKVPHIYLGALKHDKHGMMSQVISNVETPRDVVRHMPAKSSSLTRRSEAPRPPLRAAHLPGPNGSRIRVQYPAALPTGNTTARSVLVLADTSEHSDSSNLGPPPAYEEPRNANRRRKSHHEEPRDSHHPRKPHKGVKVI